MKISWGKEIGPDSDGIVGPIGYDRRIWFEGDCKYAKQRGIELIRWATSARPKVLRVLM